MWPLSQGGGSHEPARLAAAADDEEVHFRGVFFWVVWQAFYRLILRKGGGGRGRMGPADI